MQTFDFEEYTKALEEAGKSGNPSDIESFFKKRLEIIDAPLSVGGTFPDGANQSSIDEENIEWFNERLKAQLTLRNDLICFYREQGRYAECESVFGDLYSNLDEMQLLGTPLHGSILINEAGLLYATGRKEEALYIATRAKELFLCMEEQVPELLDAADNVIAACK